MPKDTFFNLPPEKRQAITDLALRMFAENDYKNVSISAFVREAGIAKGSFYQYFEDKKDLYLHLIDLAGKEKQAFFEENPPPGASMDLFSYLRWMYSVGVSFEFQNPHFAQIGYRALYGDAPLPTETVKVLQDGTRQFFEGLLARGKAQGHVRADLDTDLAAFIFNTIFTHLGDYLLHRLAIPPEAVAASVQTLERPEAEALFNRVVDILERGMGSQAA